jgi:hypothetical protein
MNTNLDLLAPIDVLAMLSTGFLLFLAARLLIQSVLVHRKGRAKFVLLAMLVVAVSLSYS